MAAPLKLLTSMGSTEGVHYVLASTFWRHCFGADVLAPTFWRQDVLALNRFGADTFWRQDSLPPDFLAPGHFDAKHIIH